MGRWHPSYCRVCGRTVAETGHISATGKCLDCAELLALENNAQMRAHSGPCFQHWRRRMAASVGAVLPDDPDVEP